MDGDQPKYPGNVLTALESGCLMDLRVRLAVQFLTSPLFAGQATWQNESISMETSGMVAIAKRALDIADAPLVEGARRGWVTELPEDTSLPDAVRDHIDRNMAAQVYQAEAGAKAQRRMAAGVVPIGANGHLNG